MYRYKKKAQATLELALAMFGVVILLLGCINTYIWVNKAMGYRQRYYDISRREAGGITPKTTEDERQVDEDWIPRLHMLWP